MLPSLQIAVISLTIACAIATPARSETLHVPGVYPTIQPVAAATAVAAGGDVPLGLGFEPTIAINPNNPRNIAIASWHRARVSTDGGATWSADTEVFLPPGYGLFPPPPGFPPYVPGGDPSLTFDSQGRLFWTCLARYVATTNGADIFILELDPATGAILNGPLLVTTTGQLANQNNDKEWIVADANPESPFADRLYIAWTQFPPMPGPRLVHVSYSDDHGATWSPGIVLSPVPEQGFPWPVHLTVAPNGDVYVAWHAQGFMPAPQGQVPNGTTGRVLVRRSTDGGNTFQPATLAFGFGAADVTFNLQHFCCTVPQATFFMQGSCQPWIMADPNIPGRVYVVANDDPDNVHGSGDEADVLIVRSDDFGQTWSAPTLVSDGPGTTFQVFPAAAIDPATGCIGVAWYDNRAGLLNPSGNFMLDFRYAVSADGGASFSASAALNDQPFDPELQGFYQNPGPPITYRIGEYFGVAMGGGHLAAVWTGNSKIGDQTMFDRQPIDCEPPNPADLNGDGFVNGLDLGILLANWSIPPGAPGCGGAMPCAADINGDGFVNGLDLGILLANWTIPS